MTEDESADGRGSFTRRQILDAAIDRFGRDGYRRTSVLSIARQSDLGSTTTYVHYPTKDALFHAALEDDLGSLFAKVIKVVDRADPSAGPASLIGVLLQELEAHPLARRLIAGLEPELTDRVLGADAMSALGAAVSERVAQGQRVGVIRADIEPALLADGLVSVVIALAMASVQVGGPLLVERAPGIDAIFQAVLTIDRPTA